MSEYFAYIILVCVGLYILPSEAQYQLSPSALITPKTDTFTIDLEHKFSLDQEYKHRGSIRVKPKADYRATQANWIDKKSSLSETDIKAIRESSKRGDSYFLKATLRDHNRTTETLIKSCSLVNTELSDIITINLSPLNDFININLLTNDPECLGEEPRDLPEEFKSTIQVKLGSVGPIPDTATYIKRLEEERQNKLREGKEDNRSFLAKYWMYIMPAVILLMIFSGPAEQGPGAR